MWFFNRPIISNPIYADNKVRLDFPTIEAETIYIKYNQKQFINLDLSLDPKQIAMSSLIDARDNDDLFSIDEFYALDVESLLVDYLPAGPVRTIVDQRSTDPTLINGYLYQTGVYDVTCGYTSYTDTGIIVTKAVRATTPRMISIASNIEADTIYSPALTVQTSGTIEFDLIKWNYDDNAELINIEEVPIPETNISGVITERFFVDSDKTGLLRFATSSIESIEVVSAGKTLDATEYTLINTTDPDKSSIKIT